MGKIVTVEINDFWITMHEERMQELFEKLEELMSSYCIDGENDEQLYSYNGATRTYKAGG